MAKIKPQIGNELGERLSSRDPNYRCFSNSRLESRYHHNISNAYRFV